MKYFKSNLLWCGVIFLVKIIYYTLRLVRFRVGKIWFGPPRIWNRPTKERVRYYNKLHSPTAVYHKIYDTNIVYNNPPITLEPQIHSNLLSYARETQFEQGICEIPNGKIAGTYTTITPDNRILWDSVGYINESLYSNPFTYRLYIGGYKHISGNVAVITGNDSYKNYNHWMTFGLPKYHLLQKSGLHIDYYITDDATLFHKESLLAIGIDPKKIIVPNQNTRISADILVTASTTTVSGNVPTRAVNYLRDTFLPNEINIQKKKIYISRVTNRKLQNEDDIMNILGKMGFERYVLDSMSIKDQAALFQSAEVVITPHGAGLTNLVFCSPGTKVIEIFHNKTVWGHYYCLSLACNLKYGYIIADEVLDTGKIRMDNDMSLSVDKLIGTLKIMNIQNL